MKIETRNKREIGVQVNPNPTNPTMFSLLCALQCKDDRQLANTLHSFHVMREAVYKEECHGVVTRCVFENY
jgi:hypothetical protein